MSVLTEIEPLPFRDPTYDPRILSAPLETMALRATMEGSPRNSASAGLAQVFLLDFEAVNHDRARRVHSVASEGGAHGRVCSCGLVMGERGDPVTTRGHLDTDTWRPTDLVVVAHEQSRGRERFAVVCHGCGWAATAWSADSAHASGREHACEDESPNGVTTASVRAHLHL
jgi:hypothetical protein